MGWKRRWAAAALAAGAAMAITTGPAGNSVAGGYGPGTDGVRLADREGFRGSSFLDVQAIAASGAGNAWLLGLVPDPEPVFVIQRWNGRRWVPVALPARLRSVIGPWELDSGIYTTSPGDTWIFPVLPDRMTAVQYALRWDGSAWTMSEVTAGPDTVLDAAVFEQPGRVGLRRGRLRRARGGAALERHGLADRPGAGGHAGHGRRGRSG